MHDSPSTTMVNDDPPRLALTRPEAAQAIGVSARSIDALIADRTSGFPILRLGTRVLVPVKELTEWLTEQTRKKGGRQ